MAGMFTLNSPWNVHSDNVRTLVAGLWVRISV